MKFVVSSTGLLNHLQAVNRVISSKNTLPILDNFLFNLDDGILEITASDLETTLITRMPLENATDSGKIAIPARILMDILKEFPEQPLNFDINDENLSVVINSENGKFTIVGQNGDDFPQLPAIKEEKTSEVSIAPNALLSGITKTIFATAEDELRPVMNGIFIELAENEVTFVASDSHKLVRCNRKGINSDVSASFILPKKPASLLKNILPREENLVSIEFDDKNAFFSLSNYKMVCRLVEGNYPSYNTVIPNDNESILTVDRIDLHNTIKRVSVFSNQASNLVKLEVNGSQLTISAQDIDFSISAYEKLPCNFEGEDMDIGFKSVFLLEILSNLTSENVIVRLSDSSRAGLFIPSEQEDENEDVLMLLMPMMVNA
ncbi:MAG: DNA polymerase III subunit beta [Bacteroidota bacterium]